MFQLGKTIVSEEIIEKEFVCNLSACKGACCVEGDAGAPLEEGEVQRLKELYPKIKPFLRPEGVAAIEQQGTSIVTPFDEHETPLVEGKECAYTIFDDGGKALCGIEQAFNEGEIDWKKPISCHLYPVRLKEYSQFTAINYEQWDICDAACSLGASLEVPVYSFVKEALIRKFGADWYRELEDIAKQYHSKKRT
jgi:hypothetical protein